MNFGHLDLRRKLQCVALASLCLSVAGVATATFASSSTLAGPANLTSTPPLISSRAVPTYFSDDANWAKTKAQAGGLSYVIMNPNSGPGATLDPGWVARLAALGTAPKMLGYVATTYAARPLADVEADIEKYRQWYGVTSIFLDETPWGCSQTEYYESLATTIRSNGGVVIMNPGGLPLNCMIDIPDVVVSFENNMSAYLSSTATNPPGYAPQKFWHLVYGAPQSRHRELEELARQRGAGYVYITSDDLPNPWDGIETFPASPITDSSVTPQDATTTTTTTTPPAPTSTSTTTTTAAVVRRTAAPLPEVSASTTSIARTSASDIESSTSNPTSRIAAPS